MWYRHEYAGETLPKTLIHGIKNSFFTKRYLINLFHVFDPLARSNCLLLRFTNFICFLKLFFVPWELLHLPDHQLYFIIVGLFLHHINVCTEFYFQVGMVIAFQMVEMCLLGFFFCAFQFSLSFYSMHISCWQLTRWKIRTSDPLVCKKLYPVAVIIFTIVHLALFLHLTLRLLLNTHRPSSLL